MKKIILYGLLILNIFTSNILCKAASVDDEKGEILISALEQAVATLKDQTTITPTDIQETLDLATQTVEYNLTRASHSRTKKILCILCSLQKLLIDNFEQINNNFERVFIDFNQIFQQLAVIIELISEEIPEIDEILEIVSCPCTDLIHQEDVPFVITTPGVYCICENLTNAAPGAAITIASSDVTLEMNNYTIRSSGDGIIAGTGGTIHNIVIKDGSVQGNPNGSGSGITINDVETITLENIKENFYLTGLSIIDGSQFVTIRNSMFDTNTTFGIFIEDSQRIEIENSSIQSNGENGLAAFTSDQLTIIESLFKNNGISGTGFSGILFSTVTNSSIENSNILNSGLHGIELTEFSNTNVIDNVRSFNNGISTGQGNGLFIEGIFDLPNPPINVSINNLIRNSEFSKNFLNGIRVKSCQNYIHNSIANGNGQNGIDLTGTGCNSLVPVMGPTRIYVEKSSAVGNGFRGMIQDVENEHSFIDNYACDNSSNDFFNVQWVLFQGHQDPLPFNQEYGYGYNIKCSIDPNPPNNEG